MERSLIKSDKQLLTSVPPHEVVHAIPPEVIDHPRSIRSIVIEQLPNLVQGIVLFLLAVTILRSSIVEAFFVPTNSMEPTVRPADYILVPKFVYGLRLPFIAAPVIAWQKPKRGEVVAFRRVDDPVTPGDESQSILVKRVIATAGDIVEVVGTSVIVNGEVVQEPYALWSNAGQTVARGHWGPVLVPDKNVFVLGDNRDESKDSRIWHDPFVRVENIQGRAVLVYWSDKDPKRSGTVL